jgi:hypothetical protein
VRSANYSVYLDRLSVVSHNVSFIEIDLQSQLAWGLRPHPIVILTFDAPHFHQSQ